MLGALSKMYKRPHVKELVFYHFSPGGSPVGLIILYTKCFPQKAFCLFFLSWFKIGKSKSRELKMVHETHEKHKKTKSV
jgi:hypothetical protein